VAVRSVIVRPPVVLAITPRELNVVLERTEPANDGEFDLVVATNILIYYDVFEQSLAAVNVGRMLNPSGVFLSNDRLLELPGSPLRSVGATDVVYMTTGNAPKGDRVWWYRRQ
jgi:hypothetical protein